MSSSFAAVKGLSKRCAVRAWVQDGIPLMGLVCPSTVL